MWEAYQRCKNHPLKVWSEPARLSPFSPSADMSECLLCASTAGNRHGQGSWSREAERSTSGDGRCGGWAHCSLPGSSPPSSCGPSPGGRTRISHTPQKRRLSSVRKPSRGGLCTHAQRQGRPREEASLDYSRRSVSQRGDRVTGCEQARAQSWGRGGQRWEGARPAGLTCFGTLSHWKLQP